MKTIFQCTVAAFLVCAMAFNLSHASSFDFFKIEKRIILTGEISKKIIVEIASLIQTNADIDELELRDSIGARGYAGLAIDDIENNFEGRHLKTFVRGECASTCAYAFLLGKTRTLLPSLGKVPTHLMIHAFRHSQTKEVDYGLTDKNFRRIVSISGGQFPIELLERIYDDSNANGDGELYIFRDIVTTKRGDAYVLVCKNKAVQQMNECEPILGVTPQDLGITIAN
jgi:hypothetical protein